jgi:hypothetical protein
VQAKYTFSDCKKDGEKYNEACAPFATLLWAQYNGRIPLQQVSRM